MRQAFVAAVAVLVLLGSTGPGLGEGPAQQERKPAIVLKPPAAEPVKAEEAPAVEAEIPHREPPPIARKKPPPPRKATARKQAPEKPAAKKAAQKKAPAQKAPVNKAPARAAASPAPQAKDCDYCYGCESLAAICKRRWVCGQQYAQRLAAGLCRR